MRLRNVRPIVVMLITGPLITARAAVAQVSMLTPAFDQFPRGSATISGSVVATENDQPLRRAALTLTRLSTPADQNGSQPTVVVLTDERGRYAFRDLPKGRYSLTASKASRVPAAWGQRTADGGAGLDVTDGQSIQNVNFSLQKSGVIAVHVTDERGEPVAGVGFQVYRFKYVNGRRVPALMSGFNGATSAAGDRRLSGLPTGDYFVRASSDLPGTTMRVSSGQQFVIAQVSGATSILNAPASTSGSSFYPGTPLMSDAQTVHVTAGSEIAIAFPIGPRVQPRIQGSVRRSDGASTENTTIRIEPGAVSQTRPPITVRADGAFMATLIVPDDYTLFVSSRAGTPQAEHAIVPLRISADVEDLAIVTRPPGAIHGRIAFDEGVPPSALKPWDVQMVALGPYTGAANRSVAFSMHDDWTFDLTGLEGPNTLTLAGQAAGGWSIKSIAVNDQNVLDWLLDIDGQKVSDAVVTLTRRTATIVGTVTAAQPATALANCPVVIFPEDQRRWTPFSRSIFATSTDAQGRFSMAGLLPGRYFAVAAADLEAGAERNADVLAALARGAVPVVVAAGESVSLILPGTR